MLDQLKKISINQDSFSFSEPLKNFTWFKVGGIAEVLFTPPRYFRIKNFSN